MARRRRVRPAQAVSPWPFVGMGLMAAAFFLYAASVLVAPVWATVALLVVWVLLLGLCVRWWTPHPRRLPYVAVGAMVFWFLALVAGGAFLGWSS